MKRDFDIGSLFGNMAEASQAHKKEAVIQAPIEAPVAHVEEEKKVKAMTWQIDVAVLERLHVYAKSNGKKKNAIVERAIKEYLDKYEG